MDGLTVARDIRLCPASVAMDVQCCPDTVRMAVGNIGVPGIFARTSAEQLAALTYGRPLKANGVCISMYNKGCWGVAGMSASRRLCRALAGSDSPGRTHSRPWRMLLDCGYRTGYRCRWRRQRAGTPSGDRD